MINSEHLRSGVPPFQLGHRPALDGLRGVAIALVLLCHSNLLPWLKGTYLGVDMFFALSGFLIASLLIEEHDRTGKIKLAAFYRRRALRLFPALWSALIVTTLLAVALFHVPLHTQLEAVGCVFAYIGNWVPSFAAPWAWSLGPTWSLAVEEQFYLLFPVLLLVLLRFRPRYVVGTMAVLFMSLTALGAIRAATSGVAIGYETEVRCGSILLGAALAYALHRGMRLPRRATLIGFLGFAMLVPAVGFAYGFALYVDYGLFPFAGLATCLLIVGCLDPRLLLGRMLAWRPLRWLGRISYSLYIWHLTIFAVIYAYVPTLDPHHDQVMESIAVVAAVCAAAVSHYVIELPFLRLKNRKVALTRAEPRKSALIPVAA